jgi:hypothetical protein
MTDIITCVLSHWTQPREHAAFARVLLLVLQQLPHTPGVDYNTEFVDVAALFVVSDSTPERVTALLQYAAERADDSGTVPLVRALFLLLFRFDGRIKKCVMTPGHGIHALLYTTAPPRERAYCFMHCPGAPGEAACARFLAAVEMPREGRAAPLAELIATCTDVWQHGMEIPWPADMFDWQRSCEKA